MELGVHVLHAPTTYSVCAQMHVIAHNEWCILSHYYCYSFMGCFAYIIMCMCCSFTFFVSFTIALRLLPHHSDLYLINLRRCRERLESLDQRERSGESVFMLLPLALRRSWLCLLHVCTHVHVHVGVPERALGWLVSLVVLIEEDDPSKCVHIQLSIPIFKARPLQCTVGIQCM